MDIIKRTNQEKEYHKMRAEWVTTATDEQLFDAMLEDSVVRASAGFDQEIIFAELTKRGKDAQAEQVLDTAIADAGTVLLTDSFNAAKAGMKL